MMSKLTAAYFVGPLTVAQITEQSVQLNLQYFIDLYEDKFWKLLLGETLYAAYTAGISANPVDARWAALDRQMYKTLGQITKVSPAANYVYFHYMRNEVTNTTGTGEKITSSENTKNASSAPKVKDAWNKMVALNKVLLMWLHINGAAYPEYYPIDVYACSHLSLQDKLLYIDEHRERLNLLKTVIQFF